MSAFRVSPGIYVSESYDGLVAIVGADDSVAVVADQSIPGPPQPAVVDYAAGQSRRLIEQTWRAVPAKVVPADAVVAGPDDIVIPAADIPEVHAREDGSAIYAPPTFNGVTFGPHVTYATPAENPDAVYAQGVARIALARRMREHPPVDEAQVESAVTAMQRALPGSHPIAMVPAETVRAVLRAAIEAGVRVSGEPR